MILSTRPSNAFLKRSGYSLLLAIGSSVDNFIVGFTIGLKSNSLTSTPSPSSTSPSSPPSSVSSSPLYQLYDHDRSKSKSKSKSKEDSNNDPESKSDGDIFKNPSSYNNGTVLKDIKSNGDLAAADSSNSNIYLSNICISLANSLGAFVAGMGGLSIQQLTEGGVEILDRTNSESGGDDNYYDHDGQNQNHNNIASLMAGVAFLYLALREISVVELFYGSNKNKQNNKQQGEDFVRDDNARVKEQDKRYSPNTTAPPPLSTMKDIASMAIPMTLNNIAGGVAGGTAGLSPYWTGTFAFLASFLMMDLGRRLGQRLILDGGRRWDDSLCASNIAGFVFAILSSLQFWDYFS